MVDEHAVIYAHGASLLRLIERGIRTGDRAISQDDEEIREVYVAQQQADRRHDDVIDKRTYDGSEGCADNDADRHVDDIAAHCEVFEFLEYDSPLLVMFAVRKPTVGHKLSR